MSESVENWLSRLGESTVRSYRPWFYAFLRWKVENGGKFAEMTPDEMVEYQKNSDNGSRFDVLDLAQKYTLSLNGRAQGTKQRYYAMIRSFFSHNRAELPRDRHFRLKGDKPRIRGILTVENIRDVCLSSKPVYRSIFLSMFQSGMGISEFEYWNFHGWESLKDQLRRDVEVVTIHLPGRKMYKNERPYSTFIGRDGIEAIRDWLKHRPSKMKVYRDQPETENTVIFTNQYREPIKKKAVQRYWINHLIKIGLVKQDPSANRSTRYGMNPHEMRDVFRSQWEKSPAKASIAEFCMGHKIDPLEYNKSYKDEDWTREQYLLALPMLQIMSTARPYGLIKVSPRQQAFQDEFTALLEDEEVRAQFLTFLEGLKK